MHAAQLVRQGTYAASNSHPALTWLMPRNRVAGITRKHDHRSQLVTRESRAGRQHRDLQPGEVIFMLRKFDDIEQLRGALHQRQRAMSWPGVESHDTAARSV